MLYLLTIAFDTGRDVWGFDSFHGNPPDTEYDAHPGRMRITSEVTYDQGVGFVDTVKMFGFDPLWLNSHCTVIPGFFEHTLNLYTENRIALLHLDCNMYESYKVALQELWPKVVEGGILLVDEYEGTYDYRDWSGARKAIDEFFHSTGYRIERDKYYGKYFVRKQW